MTEKAALTVMRIIIGDRLWFFFHYQIVVIWMKNLSNQSITYFLSIVVKVVIIRNVFYHYVDVHFENLR